MSDWRILNDDLAQQFEELLNLRNPAVHFGSLEDCHNKAGRAVNGVYSVTSKMFGMDSGNFFLCEGELYIPKDRVEEPLVKEFIVPHCCFLGYKHRVDNRHGKPTIVDDETYDDIQLTDEEFTEFRKDWRKGEDKGKTSLVNPRISTKKTSSDKLIQRTRQTRPLMSSGRRI